MTVNQNIYPYNAQVKNLPMYLCGIGGSEYQYHVQRPDGYPNHQILFSAGDKGVLKYDDITVNLAENFYFFLPANYPHEYCPMKEKWDVRWIAFDGYACADVLKKFNMTKPLAIKLEKSDSMQSLYNKMFIAQRTDKVYGDYQCSGLVYEYLLEFHRLVIDKNMSSGKDRSSILMPALTYIDDHFRCDFPMSELSRVSGVTPQHLCRIFKETMNMRPTEYLVRRRLEEAKKMLSKTNMSVSEAAAASGFSDAGYFSTVFKKYEGITPMEYKRARNRMKRI